VPNADLVQRRRELRVRKRGWQLIQHRHGQGRRSQGIKSGDTCREGEKGAARCSKSRKPIPSSRPAFVYVKGAPGCGNRSSEFIEALEPKPDAL
jgi:hypothetical protein